MKRTGNAERGTRNERRSFHSALRAPRSALLLFYHSAFRVPRSALLLFLLACSGPSPPGLVESFQPEFTGIVNADYVMSQMRQLGPRFEGCYARALARNRTAEGTIGLALQGGDKRLVPSVVTNTTSDSGLSACVLRSFEGMSIVEPDTGPRWNYTGKWDVEFRIARRKPA